VLWLACHRSCRRHATLRVASVEECAKTSPQGVEETLRPGSATSRWFHEDDAVGWTSTDTSGRFTLTTTRMPQDVQVSKTGYGQTKARVGSFSADSTATITIMMACFVRYVCCRRRQ